MRGRGGLQRFERVGVEEKSLKSYEQNAVLIHPWRFVCIASDDNFTERVADIAKGAGLLGLRVKKHTFGKATEQEVRFHNYLRTYVERDVRAMVNIIMDAVKWHKNRDDDAQFHFLRTQTGATVALCRTNRSQKPCLPFQSAQATYFAENAILASNRQVECPEDFTTRQFEGFDGAFDEIRFKGESSERFRGSDFANLSEEQDAGTKEGLPCAI